MKVFVLFFLAGFALPVFAGKDDLCEVFGALAPEAMLSVRPEFLAQHTGTYRIELKNSEIRNQCKFGGCWAYPPVSVIEREILQSTGKPVDLSEQYLLLRDIQVKAQEALVGAPGSSVKQGGHVDQTAAMLPKYGIVPVSAWKPRVAFEEDGHGTRMVAFLNARIAKFHYDADGKPAEVRAALLHQAKLDLDSIVEAYAGPFPKEFSYGGKTYADPVEFWEAQGSAGSGYRRLVVLRAGLPASLKEKKPDPPVVAASPAVPPAPKPKSTSEAMKVNDVAKEILLALKAGKSVPISVELASEYIDKKTGIMSISASPAPNGLGPMPHAYRHKFNLTAGSHAMEIVGADLTPEGKLVKFKVRNTWGAQNGDNGYFHMYPDYFVEYLQAAYLPK